jgi:hypothetical protein
MILTYKIPPTTTLQDLCLKIYNTLDAMYDLVSRNDIFTGLNINDSISLYAGVDVYYDSDLVSKKAVQINYSFVEPQTNKVKYVAKYGQSIYDIVLQTYGSLDYLNKFIADNNIHDISADFTQQIFVIDSAKIQQQVRNQFNAQNSIIYSTGEIKFLSTGGDFNIDFSNDFLI